MAEDSKQAFDPDATVAQPAGNSAADPDATVTQPVFAVPDGDPEATLTGPLARPEPDPEATDLSATFDPDATDRRPAFNASAMALALGTAKPARGNPFAPKAPPETIQANLSALGGVNQLVAMANPVLAAVPQIRRTLKHPDPASLLDSLREQLEGLEMSAVSAEIPDDTVSAVAKSVTWSVWAMNPTTGARIEPPVTTSWTAP